MKGRWLESDRCCDEMPELAIEMSNHLLKVHPDAFSPGQLAALVALASEDQAAIRDIVAAIALERGV